MSRLDIFIDRMTSQRACIDFAVEQTSGMAGPVFELGLGNGRTYHHLCEVIKARDVFVFERAIESNPASTPSADRAIVGDVFETLPQALTRFGATASFIHADLGGHNLQKNDEFARKISPFVEPLLAEGGLMVASDRMYFDAMQEVEIPAGAVLGRCFIYQK